MSIRWLCQSAPIHCTCAEGAKANIPRPPTLRTHSGVYARQPCLNVAFLTAVLVAKTVR